METLNGWYKSYSSLNYESEGTFGLSGVDTIKMDILSHLYTDVDERIMMPGWGSIIPRVPFEPMVSELFDQIYDDVVRIVEYDPRVTLQSVIVTPVYDESIIMVEITFTINETGHDDSVFVVLESGTSD